jgi:hypothetical protein
MIILRACLELFIALLMRRMSTGHRTNSHSQAPEEAGSWNPEMPPPTPDVGPECNSVLGTTQGGPARDAVGQALGKMADILQQMTEHKTPRGEDVALERFLKFSPPTFFGEAEHDQRAEQ